jgi:23S rRNA pseudouridine1911/1915/1917 synthase
VKEVVPPALAGERVDRIVAMVAGVSRSAASELVAAGAVLVDGAAVTEGKHRVREGQVVELQSGGGADPVARPAPDPDVRFEVVHADDDVIVVDKPAGLVVHPGAGNPAGTLVNGLLARYPELAGVGTDPERAGIVHRLDAGTSGLMVVARTQPAYEDLVGQMSDRTARRTYVALVWGVPAARAGVVDAPIGRSARTPTRMAVTAAGREARTRYEVEAAFADPVEASLLRCRLETGRTHQIRVHLAAIGHPVVGDERYGGLRTGLDAPRPMLHASNLAFRHPGTGEVVEFESPVPADMAAVLGRPR